jgi:uncharacterized membrane protein YfcA
VDTLVIGSLTMLAAGLVQGCTGFGMALVSVPCLMLVFLPTEVAPIVVTLSTFNCAAVAWEARRHIRWAYVAPLVVGGWIGVPFGVWALQTLDPAAIKVGAGIVVMGVSVVMLRGWRVPVRNQRMAMVPVGVASGCLGGCTSMGGPPVILFLTNQDLPKDTFRANIVVYFIFLDLGALAMYAAKELVTQTVLVSSGVFLPAMFVGTYLGVRVSKNIPEETFKKISMVIVAVMGAVLVARTMWASS